MTPCLPPSFTAAAPPPTHQPARTPRAGRGRPRLRVAVRHQIRQVRGAAVAGVRQRAGEHEAAGRRVWRGGAHVQLPTHRHRGRHHRRRRLGAGAPHLQARLFTPPPPSALSRAASSAASAAAAALPAKLLNPALPQTRRPQSLSPSRDFIALARPDEVSEVELFLNTVPLLAGLTRAEKARLVEGFYVHEYQGALFEGL